MAWQDNAACKGVDLHLFFPSRGGKHAGYEYCSRCPVVHECLEHAIEEYGTVYQNGLYGGMSAHDRRLLALERNKKGKFNETAGAV